MPRPATLETRDLVGPFGGAVVGALFLASIAGGRTLDPTEIDWLMKGDWVPHHFGWHYFRTEPWQWPPGKVAGYYAPLGTSIGLTDSIPLVAYALKPFAGWLPAEFQYLGPFVWLSFTLQGLLAARLVGRWVKSPFAQVLGATLFVLLPTLLARVGHTALCAHWLLLWALLIATRTPEARLRVGPWARLGLTAGLVQPYLAAMVLGLAAAAAAGTPGMAVVRLRAVAVAVAATVVGWWLSGLFLLTGDGALSEGGLGYFSMNLLAFVSPGDWSRVLPPLPLGTDGQAYEGFHYLGLGILALVAAAVALGLGARRSAGARTPGLWSPWTIAVGLVMAAFAVSPVVTLGSRTIVDLSGEWTAPLAMFRSSGRFAWPLVYLLLTSAVVTIGRRGPAGTLALAGAVALQLVDLSGAHAARRLSTRSEAFHSWANPLDDARWHLIAPAYTHVAIVPPPQCGATPVAYEPVVALAARHGLSVNAGVVARRDERARAGYCAALDADIDAVRLADDTLYLVSSAAARILADHGGRRVSCAAIDDVWWCTTPAAHDRWRSAARPDQLLTPDASAAGPPAR